ncbi:Serine/threonine-protein kinase PLK4 [Smittium mucronatum]|uniref:Serine/threonine-protein kinase PLK4 n=1 Tax=Smittium mucronatum TaxID=133383 RepID=A0A1R0GMW5_9FUNG|nr:Serine/threonine-protein kinase PLK4 [Smittium mucronatum]OLY82216.1 Serine/threonine-protein kinase PLK4 [Smittium mucronatum]
MIFGDNNPLANNQQSKFSGMQLSGPGLKPFPHPIIDQNPFAQNLSISKTPNSPKSLHNLKTDCGNCFIKVGDRDLSAIGKGKISSVYVGELTEATDSPVSKIYSSGSRVALKIINSGDEDAFESALIEVCILNYLFNLSDSDASRFIAKFLGIAVEITDSDEIKNMSSSDSSCSFFRLDIGHDAIRNIYNSRPSTWAIVLEVYENGNSWDWLESHPESMGQELFDRWSSQLGQTIAALHKIGVIHNDIKPQNILIDSKLNAFLCDFSAATCSPFLIDLFQKQHGFKISDFLAYGDMAGTIVYSSPEVLTDGFNPFNQDGSLDPSKTGKSDLFSLGVTLFCLFISGRPPYFSVRSNMELMLLAKKGSFYSWELGKPSMVLRRSSTITELNSPSKSPQPNDSFHPTGSITRNHTLCSRNQRLVTKQTNAEVPTPRSGIPRVSSNISSNIDLDFSYFVNGESTNSRTISTLKDSLAPDFRSRADSF